MINRRIVLAGAAALTPVIGASDDLTAPARTASPASIP